MQVSLVAEATLSPPEKLPLEQSLSSIQALSAALKDLPSPSATQSALLTRLTSEFPSGLAARVEDQLKGLLPQFVYFNEYYTLPDAVSITAFVNRKTANTQERGDQVFEALLELAGTTADRITALDQFEQLNAALSAVSNRTTAEVFEYWSQNKQLDVDLRLDAAKTGDAAPFNNGNVFRVRIKNRRHGSDTGFGERSSGFVWFFSFLVWFSQLKRRHGNKLVVLLDEPGLTLHARAQSDLLRYINEKLKPEYQVIYTTHSPFMIDSHNLLSARTVEDAEKNGVVLGTKVGDRVLSTDPDTISPLQRALDYEITQTLFVGRNTLLVEGPADLAYLQWFSHRLQKEGKTGLDHRWAICPVGGVDRIPPFVSLFRGNKLNVVALVDYATGAKQKTENAAKALTVPRLLRADTYAEQAEADIEDVLEAIS